MEVVFPVASEAVAAIHTINSAISFDPEPPCSAEHSSRASCTSAASFT